MTRSIHQRQTRSAILSDNNNKNNSRNKGKRDVESRKILKCSTFYSAWSLGELTVCCAIVFLTIALSCVAAEDCGQEEFTKCAEPLEMLHLTSEFSIGASKKEDLEKLCHELRKGVRCIQSYTRRCMDLQQRNQFNKLYHGTNQFIRDLCNKGEFQDEYLKHAPCSEMAKREFEVCASKYKETMVFLKPNKQQEHNENITINENIKTICCSMKELVDCSEDAARKICGADAAKFTRELVDKYANSLTKIYCEDFTRHPEYCGDGISGARLAVSSPLFTVLAVFCALSALKLPQIRGLRRR